MNKTWKIEYFTTSAGDVPVRDFIDAMTVKARAKTYHTFELIERYGTYIGEPHVKHLDGKIWEIRVSAFEGTFRFLFTVRSGRVILLLHGFNKKSMKTPLKDITVAKARLKEVK